VNKENKDIKGKEEIDKILSKLRGKKVRFVNHTPPLPPNDGEDPKYFNPLNQIKLRPELRPAIMTYNKDEGHGVEGLFSEIQKMLNGDNRTIKSNPYYWTESPSKTLKQKLTSFFKDPLGIKRRKNRKKLTDFLNNPKNAYPEFI
jgi:hypothetical protein